MAGDEPGARWEAKGMMRQGDEARSMGHASAPCTGKDRGSRMTRGVWMESEGCYNPGGVWAR